MKKILLTGGRAPATLELARLFDAAGHRVFVAESAPWHLCRGSRAVARNFRVPSPNKQPARFIEALRQIVQDEQIDLLLPSGEETFFVAMGRKKLGRFCIVFTETIDKLKPLHNKWEFAQRARQYGLAVPDTTLIDQPEEAIALLNSGRNLVLKPVYSRFAAKTIIMPHTPEEMLQVIDSENPWVAQEFATGRQVCTYSVVHRGRITAHSCYATEFKMGPGTTLVFKPEYHPPSFDWVRRFVQQEQFTGQISFDFIETGPNEIQAIECNPRATSGIHLFSNSPRITQAFFNGSMEMLTPQPSHWTMLAMPMIVYNLPTVRSLKELNAWLKTFFSSRDVVLKLDDPLPGLFSQWLTLSHFLHQSIKHQISVSEASTFDIEWNGTLGQP